MSSSGTVITADQVKNAVRYAVKEGLEEDRTRNIVILGVKENKEKELHVEISEICEC